MSELQHTGDQSPFDAGRIPCPQVGEGRWSFYAEPSQILKIGHGGVTVGLGENNGSELAYLHVGDGYRNGDVLLDADELTDLIDQLTIIRNAMRETR
ncbi:hypothetical protein SEA_NORMANBULBIEJR_49 [Mycobacterium phage NormanBulbieJr]|uniref:DUF7304 domain-containing protein n=5 Tax=Cheoctovirus TaxID=1623281 RepID=G1DUP2_9CAUD|nr:hypothetical protein AU088_gp049 [Mycobacterium phage Cabrinians]YP_009608123.1 hypothetical protein FDI15_gp048 [Mycobacterium phage ShiLan]YP_009954530.1 hypothetical protein I5H13_gp051 [Mycobacterium phage ArcusAngelus]YP_009955159.1 hypothetical protein I5H19_gp047 [Mycobacterium phage Burwell21]YP_009959214.1 hypothetical protein I5H58_gp054 [Mycobacterium phage Lizziana]YP_009961666.1 hypothetical protein I5H82_gp048 [Mycobacterium phage Priscilla]AWY03662.1 hypothetical protein SEA